MAFSAYTEVKFCKAYTYDIETVAIDGKQRKMTIPEGTIGIVAASTKTQTFVRPQIPFSITVNCVLTYRPAPQIQVYAYLPGT